MSKSSKSEAPWGEIDGEAVKGGTLKVSGTRTADRIIKEDETVFLLVEAKGGSWIKHDRDSHGDMIRQMSLVVGEMTEVPDELREQVAELLKQRADDRAGVASLPLGGDGDPVEPTGDGPTPQPADD